MSKKMAKQEIIDYAIEYINQNVNFGSYDGKVDIQIIYDLLEILGDK